MKSFLIVVFFIPLLLVAQSNLDSFWKEVDRLENLETQSLDSAQQELMSLRIRLNPELLSKVEPWLIYYQGRFLRRKNLDSARLVLTKAYFEFKKRNNKEGMIYCLNSMSFVYAPQGKYDSAKYVLNEAIALLNSDVKLSKSESKEHLEVAVLISLSRVLRLSGDFVIALEKAINASEKASGLTDLKLSYLVNRTIGQLYYATDNIEREKKYCIQALEAAQKMGDLKTLAEANNNLGIVYSREANYDSALVLFESSLKDAEKLNDKISISDRLQNVAIAYYFKGNLDKSISEFKRSIETADKIGYSESKMVAFINMGDVYAEKKEYSNAIESVRKGLQIAEDSKMRKSVRNAYLSLYRLHKLVKNYSEAINYYEHYVALKDSLTNENNLARIEELQIAYDTEVKENEIAELTRISELKDAQIRQRNTIVVATIIIFLLIVAITAFYYTQKNLKERQTTLEAQLKLLRLQMNPHFFFNSLTTIQSNLYNQGVVKEAEKISQLAKLMRQILEYNEQDLISVEEEVQILKNYMEISRLYIPNSFNYQINVSSGMEMDFIGMPPMLLQPFLENALIHGVANTPHEVGIIGIDFLKEEDYLFIKVYDNGPGINNNNPKSHEPMAIRITKDRLRLLEKSTKKSTYLEVKNIPDSGLMVKIKIPLVHL